MNLFSERNQMAEELSFRAEAAAEYDRAFGRISAHFLPFLLSAARLAPGQRVLDVATGTGISCRRGTRCGRPRRVRAGHGYFDGDGGQGTSAPYPVCQRGPRGRGRTGTDLARRQLRCRDLCARVDV